MGKTNKLGHSRGDTVAKESTAPTKKNVVKHGAYVVVVQNAESELAVIYRDLLPRALFPKCGQDCTVTTRTETMTAQVSFPAAALPDGADATDEAFRQYLAGRSLLGEPLSVLATGTTAPFVQKSLASAQATVSKPISQTALARLLSSGLREGFVSCHRLRGSTVFRAVFRNDEALFQAKMLLDEYEAESGIRVALTIGGDAASARYSEYVRGRLNSE